ATATLPTGRGAKGDRAGAAGLAASCFRFVATAALAGFAAACLSGAGVLATFFATEAVLATGLVAFFAAFVAGAFFAADFAGAGFAALPEVRATVFFAGVFAAVAFFATAFFATAFFAT